MKQFVAIALLAGGVIAFQTVTAPAATTPCETVLKDLRAAVAKAKLNDADTAKVTELENKGIERCNADDDKRANEFFGQALKIVGK